MEKLLLRQNSVVNETKKFHSVQIATDYVEKDLLKEFKVTRAPTILLYDYSGRRGAALVGRQEPGQLTRVLKQFLDRNAKMVEKAEQEQLELEEKRRREAEREKARSEERKRRPAKITPPSR